MASKELPRLAVIGCGAVVDYHLLPALRRIGWLPRVLVDPSAERRQMLARKMGGKGKSAISVANWEAAASAFDAAVVATPHSLHGQLGIALAKAGKHVFMEKPLATTTDECRVMVEAAKATGSALSVGLLRRYLHISRWTKALIDSGTLGTIKRFEAREGFVFNWAISSDALLRPQLAGGGVLMDTGAHTIDLLLWWLGDVASFTYRDDNEGGVEADCVIDVQMKSGATGRIELSRTRDLRNAVRIEGTEGFVDVHLSKNEVLGGSPNALAFKHNGMSASELPQQLFPELFDSELKDFCESASTRTPVGITGAEGIRSVDLIERCYHARQPLVAPWAETGSASPVRADRPLPAIAKGSTVVVTGGTGFIGGRLVERLVREHGVKVRCLVREMGHATGLARLPVQIIRADLRDTAVVDKAIKGADYVFHCAYDFRSAQQNVAAVHNLVESCVAHSVKRLVHVSTFSVYEPFPEGPLTEETRDGDRSWIYARVKLDLEKEVLDAAQSRGLAATVVQPTIVYGPFSKPWTNAPAENLIYNHVILPDRGQGLCNAVYIDDLVDGMLLAAVQPAAVGERFILSGPKPISWATFFGDFARALNVSLPTFWPRERISKENHGLMRDVHLVLANPKRIVQIIVRWPPARQALQRSLDAMPKFGRDLVNKYYFGSDGRRVGETILPDPQLLGLYSANASTNSEKARRLLGYEPQYDFESGMVLTRQYLEWAYGDARRSVAPASQGPTVEPQPAAAERAHAG